MGMENFFGELASDEKSLSVRDHSLDLFTIKGGTVSGGGLYPYGSKVAISAQASTGYLFDKWIGDGIVDANAASTYVLMTADQNLTAQFTPKVFSVTTSIHIGGSVLGAGTFNYDDTVILNAVAENGYEFIGWLINGESHRGTESLALTIEEDVHVAAQFIKSNIILTLVAEEGGTATGGGSYEPGESIHIQAIAEDGFVFSHWIGDGIDNVNSSSALVTLEESSSITASFTPRPLNTYSINLEAIPEQGGVILGSGAYTEGSVVDISAQSLKGYKFEKWLEGESVVGTDPNLSFTISSDIYLQAVFAPRDYNITVHAIGGGEVSGGGTYSFGESVHLTALTKEGYKFVGWIGSGVETPYQTSTTVKVTENLDIKGYFEPKVYSLSVNSNDGGVVFGSGDYDFGSEVNIVAQASAGYLFVKWENDINLESNSAFTTITITQDSNFKAIFEPLSTESPVEEPVTTESSEDNINEDSEPEETTEENTELDEKQNNIHVPRADNFHLLIENTDYEIGDTLHAINGVDEDKDEIFYEIISGNIDLDEDGISMFDVNSLGFLSMLDSDEIIKSADTTLKLVISLSDERGKSSSIEGTITIRPRFVLTSHSLGDHWYQSDWFGLFMTTENNWVYHQKLGWVYIFSNQEQGYWFWDMSFNGWMWTESRFFPWSFSSLSASWIYYGLDEEKVRLFDHNEQKWRSR